MTLRGTNGSPTYRKGARVEFTTFREDADATPFFGGLPARTLEVTAGDVAAVEEG